MKVRILKVIGTVGILWMVALISYGATKGFEYQSQVAGTVVNGTGSPQLTLQYVGVKYLHGASWISQPSATASNSSTWAVNTDGYTDSNVLLVYNLVAAKKSIGSCELGVVQGKSHSWCTHGLQVKMQDGDQEYVITRN